jgi:hypothetical protein
VALQHLHCRRSIRPNGNGDRRAAVGWDFAADPLLKLLPAIFAQSQETDATSLLGFVGPHDLAIRFNRRGAPRKREFQVAKAAFDDGPDDLAAQPSFADVEENSTAVRPKSDVDQLIEPPPGMGAAFGGPWCLRGADRNRGHGHLCELRVVPAEEYWQRSTHELCAILVPAFDGR